MGFGYFGMKMLKKSKRAHIPKEKKKENGQHGSQMVALQKASMPTGKKMQPGPVGGITKEQEKKCKVSTEMGKW